MIRPVWVYTFKRHAEGTRYDLTGWEGPEPYAPLVHCLKRSGEPVLYLNRPRFRPGSAPDPRRAVLGLFAPGGGTITGVFEPSPEHPGQGFGDALDRKDALLIRRDDEAETLKIYVFPGLGLQSLSVFMAWIDGGVSLELEGARGLYNNGNLDTNSVADGDD